MLTKADIEIMTRLDRHRVTNWLDAAASSSETVKDDRGLGRTVRTGTDHNGMETNAQWCVREAARLRRKGAVAVVKKTSDGLKVALYVGLEPKDVEELERIMICVGDIAAFKKEED